MEGNLFNSGFLGSKFLWWIGQVADDRTWRDNQNPKKVGEDGKDPEPNGTISSKSDHSLSQTIGFTATMISAYSLPGIV